MFSTSRTVFNRVKYKYIDVSKDIKTIMSGNVL